MLKFVMNNVYTRIMGKLHHDPDEAELIQAALHTELSYVIPGVEWSPKYKEGVWDGRISLYNRSNQRFPTGLKRRVTNLFNRFKMEMEFEDKRNFPEPNFNVTTAFSEYGRDIRDYQDHAASMAANPGRGILSMATGAGKTVTACEIIARQRVAPMIFFVPSISLLRQTHREFGKYLRVDGEKAKVGFIGAGVCDLNPAGVNVMTVQTALAAFDQKYQEKGNKVVHDTVAGEKNRKPLDQLQNEFEDAKKAENISYQQAQDRFADRIYNLEQEAKRLHKAMAKESRSTYRNKMQAEYNRKKRDLDKMIEGITGPAVIAREKAESALETRLATLENKEAIRKLITDCKSFIVDETHIAAVVVEALAQHMHKAFYRIGVTATAYREDGQEIRIEGAMGTKLVDYPASYLIQRGFLVKPDIYMVKINHIEATSDYREVYDKHIVKCWERNYRIKQFAEGFKAAGLPTIIFVKEILHGQILESMICDSVFVSGSDESNWDIEDPSSDDFEDDYRRRMLDKTEANEIILIATSWAYTGIDAPKLAAEIMAESGSSVAQTLQMAGRVLRAADGKKEAAIVFFDDEQKNLHDHSIRRLRAFQLEPEFRIHRIK